MIRRGFSILIAVAIGMSLVVAPQRKAGADNPPTPPSISNIGVGVNAGVVTFNLCVLPGTEPGVGPPIGGGVVITPTSGPGQFQAMVTYNGQGCGSGAYLAQATFTALPAGRYSFGSAAVVLNGTGLVPGLTPQSSFAPNTQGQTVLTDCPTIFNFSTSVNQAPQNCVGIGVVGDINGGPPLQPTRRRHLQPHRRRPIRHRSIRRRRRRRPIRQHRRRRHRSPPCTSLR